MRKCKTIQVTTVFLFINEALLQEMKSENCDPKKNIRGRNEVLVIVASGL